MQRSILLTFVFSSTAFFKDVAASITINSVGEYTCVFDSDNTYTFYDALAYCESQGVSLASIHSDSDQSDFENSLVDPLAWTWIGLNDINNEAFFDGSINASWEYTDGTPYDYEISWFPSLFPFRGDPDGGDAQDCVLWWIYTDEVDNTEYPSYIDVSCGSAFDLSKQFVCNNFEGESECDIEINECNPDGDSCQCIEGDGDDNENEDENCEVCDPPIGCSQCKYDYFKKDFSYPCVSCGDTFTHCLHCQDFLGCAQCEPNYDRYFDEGCELYRCRESPCNNESNNCRVCNNGYCSQCDDSYVLKNTPGVECFNCQDTFGENCIHCGDMVGCQQCIEESQRYLNDDGFYVCS